MKFDEIYNAFGKIINDVKSDKMGNTMVQIGSDALGLIRKRITETGINAEGKKFPPYSQKPMLVGCKSMNSDVCKSFFGKEKNKEHKWVTLGGRDLGFSSYLSVSAGGRGPSVSGDYVRLAVLERGYKQFRDLHGRQTNYVDFIFSGRMWMNIRIISSNTEHNNGVVTIGASTEETKKILAGNAERKGQILALNNEEVNWLTNTYKQKIKQFFREAV